MARFRIKLGPTPQQSEVEVNGRIMPNVIALSIRQGAGLPQVSVTIPAEEITVEGDGEVNIIPRIRG